MNSPRVLLLSLRPKYATAILSGDKTIEVRRRPVNAAQGTRIILYASSPLRAVVGTARLASVLSLRPAQAWSAHATHLGLARRELMDYLSGVDLAHLLLLEQINQLDRPLHLDELREDAPFQPPQSFRYIHAGDPSSLHDLAVAR